ncbi:MAG: hypothetical protein ABW000_04480 [Actinoplanes sp.]
MATLIGAGIRAGAVRKDVPPMDVHEPPGRPAGRLVSWWGAVSAA